MHVHGNRVGEQLEQVHRVGPERVLAVPVDVGKQAGKALVADLSLILVADAQLLTGLPRPDADTSSDSGDGPRPVDPARDVDVEPFGELLWRGPGGPVRLPAATVRRLACDSDYQMVLRHRGRIVGVVSTRRMVDPARRASLVARDRHCRFPGCRAPASKCVAHHVVFWPDGTTTIVNLLLLCRHHHRLVHHGGWILNLEPDGTCEFRRGRHRYTTRPADQRTIPRSRPPPVAVAV